MPRFVCETSHYAPPTGGTQSSGPCRALRWPGEYTVNLHCDGKSSTQRLTIQTGSAFMKTPQDALCGQFGRRRPSLAVAWTKFPTLLLDINHRCLAKADVAAQEGGGRQKRFQLAAFSARTRVKKLNRLWKRKPRFALDLGCYRLFPSFAPGLMSIEPFFPQLAAALAGCKHRGKPGFPNSSWPRARPHRNSGPSGGAQCEVSAL